MTAREIPALDPLEKARTLPAWMYRDEAVLELEYERIFARAWQWFCRSEQVANPGDYVAGHAAREPVVVVRGQDGLLRGFSNVCRHRAGPVAVGAGNAKAFRCAYHGWTYALTGALRHTPEFEGVADFDPSCNGLPPVAVEEWADLLFVNVDPEAKPLAATLGEMPSFVSNYRLGDLRFRNRVTYEFECNWKAYVDNYLEGYHVPFVHPRLAKAFDMRGYTQDTWEMFSRQYGSPGNPRNPASRADNPYNFRTLSPARTGLVGEETVASQYFFLFPNFMLNVHPDHMSANLIQPAGPERTVAVFDFFFESLDGDLAAYTNAKNVEFADEIQREDIWICEQVQKGLRSASYEAGRFSVSRENAVHHFQTLVSEFLRSATAAPHPR